MTTVEVSDVEKWLARAGYKPCGDEGWWKRTPHSWSHDQDALWVLVPTEITEAWLSREARFFKKTVEELRAEIVGVSTP